MKKIIPGFLLGVIATLSIPYAVAQITDTTAIKYLNEEVRPWCESVRALNVEGDAMVVKWYAGMNTTIGNTADVIEDGRDAEGVSRITGADVHSVMSAVIDLQTALAAYDQIISKPTVRPIEVN